MKRTLRGAWVLAANGFVVWLTITRLSAAMSSPESWKSFELWIEIILEILTPVVGIVLEIVGWKFANRMNVGYLSVAAGFWMASAVWRRSDPFFGVLLIIISSAGDSRGANPARLPSYRGGSRAVRLVRGITELTVY